MRKPLAPPPLGSKRAEPSDEGMQPPAQPSPISLMRVTVQIGDRRFDEDLATQAMITPNIDALDDALAKNPSRYAEWAMLEALAESEVGDIRKQINVLDTDIKELEARIYLEVIAAPVPAGAKPPTVDAIKAVVTIDPRRIDLVRRKQELEGAELTARGNADKIKVGRKTMEEKKDSLLELARNWRQQMQTQLSVGQNPEKFRPGGGK